MRTIVASGTLALAVMLALCGCSPTPTVENAPSEEAAVATSLPTQPPTADDIAPPPTPENAVFIAEYASTQGSHPRTTTREFMGTMGIDLMCAGDTPVTFGVVSGSSAEVPCDGKTYRIQYDSNVSTAEGGLDVTAEPDTRWAAVVWLFPEG